MGGCALSASYILRPDRHCVSHPFNITLMQPERYTHAQALSEITRYLCDCIGRCGHQVDITTNFLSSEKHNVIVGAHLVEEKHRALLPRNTIVFNSEQLADDAGWHFSTGVYRRIVDSHFVWDYSEHNLSIIGHDRKAQIPFHYCAALRRTDMPRTPGDAFLFYGVLTKRRRNLLTRLRQAGVKVRILFNVYGDARDARMFNCRAVLDLHKSDELNLFEPVRCFYPLINGIPVISEPFRSELLLEAFEKSMFVTGGETVVEDIVALYKAGTEFERSADRLVETFAATDPILRVRDALAKYFRFLERE